MSREMRRVYLDHNASTPLRREVVAQLREAAQRDAEAPGNPASVHSDGRAARARLTNARGQIAAALGAQPEELFFTGSGTEANVWALKGAFFARKDPSKRRVVASAIEHPSVLLTLEDLRLAHGAEIVLVRPERDGRLQEASLRDALDDRTVLCSVQWANHETGVLQPVEEIARLCAARGIPFHTDAVQALGKTPVDLSRVSASLVSLSSHKVGGPRGVGALVARAPIAPLIPGHQEGGRRGGTPDVTGAEAFALALGLSCAQLAEESERIAGLRDRLERGALALWPAKLQGTAPRVANTANLGFPGIDAEALLIALDLEGFAVSTGAACASGSLSPSHVLLAMGASVEEARGSLRISLGHTTGMGDVDSFLTALDRCLKRSAG